MVRTGRRRVLAAAPVLLLAGCGTATVVTEQSAAPAAPYDGPLQVERRHPDSPDVMKRGGAALALECDGNPVNGGGADYVEADLYQLGDTPAAALGSFLDAEGSAYGLPTEGYRLERQDDGRALLSYDVDRLTKVAFVVADGLADHEGRSGWGVETWQHITFIHWREDGEPVQYVGPGAGALGELLRARYDGATTLPAGARDTGYRRDGRELWLTARGDAAYLVRVGDPRDVEQWPAAREPILCA